MIHLKHFIILTIFLVSAVWVASDIRAASPSPSPSPKTKPSPSASASAEIDPETIKANIKKRIEQVIQNQTATNQKKVAYLGTLLSVTTNSFSLETGNGIKQASTSAVTTVISLPGNKEIKLEDISISDYLAAMGFVNESTKVLDVRRILVLKTPPPAPVYKSFYGEISQIDTKKNVTTLTNPKSGESKVFKLTSKTKLYVTDSRVGKAKIDPKDVVTGSNALIVYDPAESDKDDNTGITILVKASTAATVSSAASPSPSPKMKPSPTPKAVKPASPAGRASPNPEM